MPEAKTAARAGTPRHWPEGPVLALVGWDDPGSSPTGFDPRSRYAERFWLPVLGPTAGWLLRRLADLLDHEPEGGELDLSVLAAGLGLGWSAGVHSPLRRAVARCERHDVVRWRDNGVLAVRTRLGFVPRRLLLRLPVALQAEHRDWVAGLAVAESDTMRRRARLAALELADLGVDDACIERHLLRRGVHPASAFEAARWVRSPEVGRLLSG
jgi:hypothetical protein